MPVALLPILKMFGSGLLAAVAPAAVTYLSGHAPDLIMSLMSGLIASGAHALPSAFNTPKAAE